MRVINNINNVPVGSYHRQTDDNRQSDSEAGRGADKQINRNRQTDKTQEADGRTDSNKRGRQTGSKTGAVCYFKLCGEECAQGEASTRKMRRRQTIRFLAGDINNTTYEQNPLLFM